MTDGKKSRGVKAARAIRAFQTIGFQIDHTSGSHCVLRHPDGRRAVIPLHREVKPGLLFDELKKNRIAWEEFEEAL